MARSLEIDVPMLVAAMTRGPDLSADLSLANGEIDLYPEDPSWRDEASERAGHRVEIPRIDGSVLYRWMGEFASAVEEDDLRRQLEDALDGRGAFGRFRRVIERYPDLRAEWEREQAERVIEEARPWLVSLDVAAVFHSPPPPAAPPQSDTRAARVGLVDLLLLGAPDGKTELLEGRVSRVFVGRSAAEARALFKTVARELCEMHGIAWRNRFIEGRERYEVDRFVLTIEGSRVDLAVAVPRAIWQTFAGGG